jgi:predicted nuclease of predicted toxin-antitoxin system
VRFLVDQCLSPRLAEGLNDLGHDAIHTAELGLESAEDAAVLGAAREDGRVVITADSDFGTLLASTRATSPSVLYVRRSSGRRADAMLEMIAVNLPALDEALSDGSVVVLGEGSLRVRALPIL